MDVRVPDIHPRFPSGAEARVFELLPSTAEAVLPFPWLAAFHKIVEFDLVDHDSSAAEAASNGIH
jgi:hypothetical protein